MDDELQQAVDSHPLHDESYMESLPLVDRPSDYESRKSQIPAMNQVQLPVHPHPLYCKVGEFRCFGCARNTQEGKHYQCRTCYANFHPGCAEASPEINDPFHPRHALTLLTRQLDDDVRFGKCSICEEILFLMAYHCSICSFSIDPGCAREPPPLAIDYQKSHGHTLTLLLRHISFTCNACGLVGDRYSYVCVQCNFIVHKDCIYLPHIIRIIRHQHRLSLNYFLPPEKWFCGVCRKEIDWNYGAYSCNKGCLYAVHSKCATRKDAWDGKELEDIEEIDEIEDVEPFEKIDDRLIRHFSHKHDLRLSEDDSIYGKSKLCQVCILPVWFGRFYGCLECDNFILHETCASLPRKIGHLLHPHPLTLQAEGSFTCSACGRFCSGFQYKCCENCDFKLDARCASISEPFIHECHPHPLFLISHQDTKTTCKACRQESNFVLNCIDCDFVLDFKCATLPIIVRHKYDEHTLRVRCGEDASSPYWCEICEEEIDANKWFYTCDDCGFTSHAECALGSLPYVKPGQSITIGNCSRAYEFEMAPNNRISRPLCYICHRRCESTLVFKRLDKYFCLSLVCVSHFLCLTREEEAS